ncbi:MAG: hypothetical protein EOP34_06460 [Rickettsiales bacterium]|nr:MAG: hypothetical protein EOP34_06460 [Rickettsiales bacterium]
MTFIDLKPFTSDNSTHDLLNRFKTINRMGDLANDKVLDIVDKLSKIMDHQNYFGASILDNNSRKFIFVADKSNIPQFIKWMSTISDNQLRDIVNRISFIYNANITPNT